MSTAVGTPVNRVDGMLKVTGAARYAADHVAAHLTYGVPVVSTIARGRAIAIDTRRAESAPGVITILTREKWACVPRATNDFGDWTKLGEARLLFEDDQVHYAGQYLALVVGDTLEQATAGAALVDVKYEEQPPVVATIDALRTLDR